MSSTERDPLLPVNASESSNTSINTMRESNFNCGSRIFVGCVYTLAYLLIGASMFVVLWYAIKSSPITTFQLHIILCVIGVSM